MTLCLLFDLFGTLVEYETDRSRHNLEESFETFSARLSVPISYDDYVGAWGRAFARLEAWTMETGREFLMDQVAVELCNGFGMTPDAEFQSRLIDQYIEEWMTLVRPIPGAAGIVQRLAPHYRLGLISNTHHPPMVRSLIDDMELGDVLEVVVLSAEVGVPKPHPRIFETALQGLSVEAEQSVYIGDSFEHDYKGATAMGMDCYLIGNHARVPRDRLLGSVLDLSIYFNTTRPG